MLKAALIGSGSDVDVDGQVAAPTRGGGGLANPLKADVPLVLAAPASVSFGLVRPGVTVPARVDLTDAGGGAGVWDVAVDTITATAGASLVAAADRLGSRRARPLRGRHRQPQPRAT